jgi:dTDP-D-glucose 4,6-dehydratase
MRLLTTSGSGFIGSSFIMYLLTRGSDVRVTNLDALTFAGIPRRSVSSMDRSEYRFFDDALDATIGWYRRIEWWWRPLKEAGASARRGAAP